VARAIEYAAIADRHVVWVARGNHSPLPSTEPIQLRNPAC
jgi:hypothetical protein